MARSYGPRWPRLSDGWLCGGHSNRSGGTIITVRSVAKGLPPLLLSALPLAPLFATTVQRATSNGIRAFVSRNPVPTSGGYVLGRGRINMEMVADGFAWARLMRQDDVREMAVIGNEATTYRSLEAGG